MRSTPFWTETSQNYRRYGMRALSRDGTREGKTGIANPVIIHHAGNEKPWRRFVYGKTLLFPDLTGYHLYKDFLKDSPWPGMA